MLLTIVNNKIIYNDLIIVDEIKAVDKSCLSCYTKSNSNSRLEDRRNSQ